MRLSGILRIWLFAVLSFGFLVSCNLADNIGQSKANSEADTYEKLTKGRVGAAYRIQMDLELKETGEPINFDYMVRCANIDFPGSFHF